MTVLRRSSPIDAGVDAAGISNFLAAVAGAGIELHSFMLVKSGSVVAETWWQPYDSHTPHLLYSLSKSFTSVAAGIAESEGLLSMDDLLSSHLKEAHAYGTATIADALRMSVGHLMDPVLDPSFELAEADDAELWRLLENYAPEREPGEFFTYDQLATFAVAKIVEKVSGGSLFEYLRPRIFEPIGAQEAKWAGGDANPGFTGLYLNTESIAAFGQLLLQGGEWDGKQLIPAQWLTTASSVQMKNDADHRFPQGQPVEPDSALGYGYQFWIGRGSYHAGGAYSQIALVLPEYDAVVAITAATLQGQALLDAIHAHLEPALSGTSGDSADVALPITRTLPAPVAGLGNVAYRLSRATLGTVAVAVTVMNGENVKPGWAEASSHAQEWTQEAIAVVTATRQASSPLLAQPNSDVSGITFVRADADPEVPVVRFGGLTGVDLPELSAVRVTDTGLELTIDGAEVSVAVGFDTWVRNDIPGEIAVPFAIRGGWSEAGIGEFEFRMIETPHTGYLVLDPGSAVFTFWWREPTLMGRDLAGYRV